MDRGDASTGLAEQAGERARAGGHQVASGRRELGRGSALATRGERRGGLPDRVRSAAGRTMVGWRGRTKCRRRRGRQRKTRALHACADPVHHREFCKPPGAPRVAPSKTKLTSVRRMRSSQSSIDLRDEDGVRDGGLGGRLSAQGSTADDNTTNEIFNADSRSRRYENKRRLRAVPIIRRQSRRLLQSHRRLLRRRSRPANEEPRDGLQYFRREQGDRGEADAPGRRRSDRLI